MSAYGEDGTWRILETKAEDRTNYAKDRGRVTYTLLIGKNLSKLRIFLMILNTMSSCLYV